MADEPLRPLTEAEWRWLREDVARVAGRLARLASRLAARGAHGPVHRRLAQLARDVARLADDDDAWATPADGMRIDSADRRGSRWLSRKHGGTPDDKRGGADEVP